MICKDCRTEVIIDIIRITSDYKRRKVYGKCICGTFIYWNTGDDTDIPDLRYAEQHPCILERILNE